MSVINSIILGIIQGLTEFLPISSFGLLVMLRDRIGLEQTAGILFEAILHLGTAASVVAVFRKDFSRILAEIAGMGVDLAGNVHVWFHNRRSPEEDLPYHALTAGTWRKLSAMVLTACIPAAMIGYSARRLVKMAAASSFIPGALMMVTALFLLVTDLSRTDEGSASAVTGFDAAMWMGICRGLAVFPGLSGLGLSLCSGMLCGRTRRYAVKFSVIISVPVILGAFALELGNFPDAGTYAISAGSIFAGVLAAFAGGILTIRFMLLLTQRIRLRWFALMNFIFGVYTLISVFSQN